MSKPTESLAGKKGDPRGWLGFHRYEKMEEDLTLNAQQAGEVVGAGGPLRGVRKVRWASLQKAMKLKATPHPELGEGVYAVTDPDKPEGEDPLHVDGGPEWVNLYDPRVDRCHCFDFVTRSEEAEGFMVPVSKYGPCKHVLAALIAEEHPSILELVKELSTRNQIAAAVQKEAVA